MPASAASDRAASGRSTPAASASGGAQQGVRGLRERIEAAADRVTHALRKRQRVRSTRRETAALAQPARHLLHEEGVALGELAERLREGGLEPRARDGLRELRNLAGGEAAQRHAGHVGLVREVAEHACERVAAAHLDVPVGPDQQQRRIPQLAREEQEETQRVAVGPVQIVDAQEQRRALGRAAQLARHAFEPAEARLLALGGPERAEDLALGADTALGAARRERAQRLEEGPERGRAFGLPTLPGQPAHAAAARFRAELFERPGLTDAGLAHDQHDAAPTRGALVERGTERLHRLDAPHEGGSARALAHRGARSGRVAELRLGHEAVAAPVHGLDHARPRARVAHRAPGRADATRQHAVAHAHARPERGEQLGLRHHALAVAQQVEQHVEHARLELHDLAPATELVALLVELAVGEAPDHPGRRRLAASTARTRSSGTSSGTGSSGSSKACFPSATLRR